MKKSTHYTWSKQTWTMELASLWATATGFEEWGVSWEWERVVQKGSGPKWNRTKLSLKKTKITSRGPYTGCCNDSYCVQLPFNLILIARCFASLSNFFRLTVFPVWGGKILFTLINRAVNSSQNWPHHFARHLRDGCITAALPRRICLHVIVFCFTQLACRQHM